MTLLRTAASLLAAALAACGPSSGAETARYVIEREGDGDALVTALPHGDGARWTYLVGAAGETQPREALDTWFEGTVEYAGCILHRQVTRDQIVYLEESDVGQLYWGSDDEGMLDAPMLLTSLPLRQGRAWSTGDEDLPDWYRYVVVAVEQAETPAGSFRTARVVQTNAKTGDVVSRWYAEGVGLVQRIGLDARGGTTASSVLLRYSAPGGTP